MYSFTSLKIKDIIKETPNAVSLVFDIPSDLQSDFRFLPGQFLTLQADINNQKVRRSYSISSVPNSKSLQVSIKKIPNGIFSTYATDSLKPLDVLEVGFPEGRFTLVPNNENEKNYLAFVAGSGITPVLSMLTSVMVLEPKSTFTLFYGNKTQMDTLFYNKLQELQKQYSNRLSINYIFSKEQVAGSLFGRIDANKVNDALKNQYKDITFHDIFLCGPVAMQKIVKETLLDFGCIPEQIHQELFFDPDAAIPVSLPEQPQSIQQEKISQSVVKVLVDDEEFELEVNSESTLLDQILAKDIDVPYSCQGGVCCSCICRVTEGKATMPANKMLTDKELQEGLVLSCQAYADDLKITLDFDDA